MMQSQTYKSFIADKPEGRYPSGGLLTRQLELIPDKTMLALEPMPSQLRFMTIDDLRELAQTLVDGLNKLGERKHPLSIRRGVKRMPERKGQSEMLKASGKTYFFDERMTKDGKPFLVITESRFKGEDEKPERTSIIVFQDNLKDFAEKVALMAAKIGTGNSATQ